MTSHHMTSHDITPHFSLLHMVNLLKLEYNHKSKDESEDESEDLKASGNEDPKAGGSTDPKISETKTTKRTKNKAPVITSPVLTERSKRGQARPLTIQPPPGDTLQLANPVLPPVNLLNLVPVRPKVRKTLTLLHGLQILCFLLRLSSVILIICANWAHSKYYEQIMSTCRIAIAISSFLSVFFLTKERPTFSLKYFEEFCTVYSKTSIDLIVVLIANKCNIVHSNHLIKEGKIRREKEEGK